MVAAGVLAGIAGVLVLRTDRLHEADRLELAVVRGRDEFLLVPQVRRTGRRARRVVRVVIERLVVELEQLVRAVRIDRRGQGVRVGAGPWDIAVGPSGTANVTVRVRPAAG